MFTKAYERYYKPKNYICQAFLKKIEIILFKNIKE